MRAINHALTGAVIGLAVSPPVVALPLALVSHFICDAIPHHGVSGRNRFMRSMAFTISLAVDALLCVALVGLLAVVQPTNWLWAAAAAFVATAPDLAHLPGWLRTRRGQRYVLNPNRFMTFASRIQWFERPIGAVVEAAWLFGAVSILITYL